MVNLPMPSNADKISFQGNRDARKLFEKNLEDQILKTPSFNGHF